MRLLSASRSVAQIEAETFAIRCCWDCVVSRCRAHNCRRSYDAIGELTGASGTLNGSNN